MGEFNFDNDKKEANKIADAMGKYLFWKKKLREFQYYNAGIFSGMFDFRGYIALVEAERDYWKHVAETEQASTGVKKEIELTEQASGSAKRLKLTSYENEMLNEKIVEKVNEFIDSGKGSQDRAFKELAKDSKRVFKMVLTAKQIEGRYKRNKKRYNS